DRQRPCGGNDREALLEGVGQSRRKIDRGYRRARAERLQQRSELLAQATRKARAREAVDDERGFVEFTLAEPPVSVPIEDRHAEGLERGCMEGGELAHPAGED